jgi:hypothetical protein
MARIRRSTVRAALLTVLPALVFSASCAGASDDEGRCSKLCQEAQDECPLLPRVEDCQGQCLYEDARAVKTGCQRELDATTDCSASLEDICAAPTACRSNVEALWACIGTYCAKHPSDGYCDDRPPGG